MEKKPRLFMQVEVCNVLKLVSKYEFKSTYLVGEVFDSGTFSSFLGGLFSVRLLVVVFRLSEDLSEDFDFRCFFSGLESSRLLDFFRCLDLVSFLEDLRSSFLLDRLLFFLLFLSSSDSDSSLLSDLNHKK